MTLCNDNLLSYVPYYIVLFSRIPCCILNLLFLPYFLYCIAKTLFYKIMEDQKTANILQLSNGRPGRRCPLGSAENSFWQLWSRNRHGVGACLFCIFNSSASRSLCSWFWSTTRMICWKIEASPARIGPSQMLSRRMHASS